MKKSSTGDQGNQAAPVAELQQFRSLLQNHPLPIFIVDISSKDPLKYTFLATNRAAELLYGYSEEEFLQMPLTQLRPAEDLEWYSSELKKDENGQATFQTSTPHRHQTSDGSIINVEI